MNGYVRSEVQHLGPRLARPSRARAWSSPGRSRGSSAHLARPLWARTTWKEWMSRRCGLWADEQQVGVAAGADRRVGAERPIDRVVLAGGEELAFILRPLLAVAPLPGRVDLEERELDERPLGHGRDASARLRSGSWPVAAPAAAAEPRITVAMLPPGTDVEEIAAAVPGIAPGVMSAGLGRVPAGQTYLDIGQGNRIFTSLYPEPLPPALRHRRSRPRRPLGAGRRPGRRGAGGHRAGPAGARRSRRPGSRSRPGPLAGSPALIAADRRGLIDRTGSCRPGVCRGVTILAARTDALRRLADRLAPGSAATS